MKRAVYLSLFLALCSIAPLAQATPIACPTTGSLATLIALNPTGCLINGLLFDTFAISPSATGTGTLPTAAQVTYTLDNPGTSTGTGQLIYGFEFNPNMTVSGIGAEDLLLTYTIVAPSAEITSVHLLENAVVTGTGSTATVSETDCGKLVVGGGCTFFTDQVTPTSPHQDVLGIGPYTEVDISKDINVSSTTAGGITRNLPGKRFG